MPIAGRHRRNAVDVDLAGRAFTVRHTFAKGRLKTYPKTVRSRRHVPLRANVVDAVARLPPSAGDPVPRGPRTADQHRQLALAGVGPGR